MPNMKVQFDGITVNIENPALVLRIKNLILRKAKEVNPSMKKKTKWSAEDRQFLKDNMYSMSAGEIAEALNRTVGSITAEMFHLKQREQTKTINI